MCSDAATGYILSFSIYTGKDPNVSISLNGLAYDVVMKLLGNNFNKGYSVFVDNFDSSPNLFLDLFNKGVWNWNRENKQEEFSFRTERGLG